MNKYDVAFLELKEKVNEMAQDMNYKVHYHVGPVGEPLKILIDNVPVRALRICKGNQEIIVARLKDHVYAFSHGQRWDITANFIFYEMQRYLMLEEKIKAKFRKESPKLAIFDIVLSKLIEEGLDINETFDIFTPCQQQSYPLREIRI